MESNKTMSESTEYLVSFFENDNWWTRYESADKNSAIKFFNEAKANESYKDWRLIKKTVSFEVLYNDAAQLDLFQSAAMVFILNIYKKDGRTKSGRRIVGSYDYERKDREAMNREVAALYPTYKEEDGYSFEVLEVNATVV